MKSKKLDNQYYKCSRFTFPFQRDHNIALYHSIFLDIVYGNNSLLSLFSKFTSPTTPLKVVAEYPVIMQQKISKVIDNLSQKGFLVDANYNEDDLFQPVRKHIYTRPHITELFLLPTDRCNFHCRYCHIMNSMPTTYKFSNMEEELMKKSINYFAKLSNESIGDTKNIVFYGGEPLLNFKTIQSTIRYARQLEKSNKFNGKIQFTMFSNCSLVSSSIAKFLAENNVVVIASIDGTKDTHNQMRVYKNGDVTFDHVLKGYMHLKEQGCNVGISCTVANHNVLHLPEIVRYFYDKLQPTNIGFNTLHAIIGGGTFPSVPLEKVTNQIIEAYKVARELGIYLVHAINRIKVIADKKPRIKDCPACSRQVVITSDGQIGPCEVFTSTRNFFIDFPNNDTDSILSNEIFVSWHQRNAFDIPKCHLCEAISLCGAGCTYDAYNAFGTLMAVDKRACVQSKMFLSWIIWDLFERVKLRFNPSEPIQALMPNKKELDSLYGNISVDTMTRPLEEYHSRAHGEMNSGRAQTR